MFNYESLPVGNINVMHKFFSLQAFTVEMNTLGIVFDWLTSLLVAQRVLCTSIGQAIWLVQFTPVRHDHLHFVQALLQAFCSLGICCAFTGLYSAYIAGVLDKFCWENGFCICHLYISKSTNAILVSNLKKATKFTICSFNFQFRSRGAFNVLQIFRPTTFRMRVLH